MALKKCVDGVMMDMTPEEEAEFLATAPEPSEAQEIQDPVAKLAAFLAANPDVRALLD
jgi:hypothetical protein